MRRGRIILSGQVTDGVKFFVETDNDNAGKDGTAVTTDVQDAFMDVRLNKDHWVEAGLILLPFSFENKASVASLLGNDYNGEAVKLVNTFVWRDYGVEFHGNFGDKFAYRIGTFDGAPGGSKNLKAPLRFTGHLAYNPIGKVETGWFFSQNRLGKANNYLSIGAWCDCQKEATIDASHTSPVDNKAWVVDLQSDFVLDEIEVTLNADYYDGDNSIFKGNTAFAEAGLRRNQLMLTLKDSIQESDEGNDTNDFTVGLHYFLKEHNARGGIEYRCGDSNDWTLLGI